MSLFRSASIGLALFCVHAPDAHAQVLSHLAGQYGLSASYSLTTSPDESRIYVGDGASIAILDASGLPLNPPATALALPTLFQVPVDASVVGLLHDVDPNKVLYIAGGSFGLLKMNTNETPPCVACDIGKVGGCNTVTTLDDDNPATTALADNDKWCFDLEFLGADQLVALFSAQGDTELRVYDLATLRAATAPVAPLKIIAIPASTSPAAVGTGWNISIRGPKVYVAMGVQGIVRVDLTNLNQPVVDQGPVFDSVRNPFKDQLGDVRDVLITQRWLYATVDGFGLAQVDTNAAWTACLQPSTCSAVTVFSLATPGVPSFPRYAYRLSAQPSAPGHTLLGVATIGVPARASEGNLGVPWSTMSFDVSSGTLPSTYDDGDVPQLLTFDATNAAGVQPATMQIINTGVGGTWRALLLGKASGKVRSFELHQGEVHVRNLTATQGIVASRLESTLFGMDTPRIGYSRLDPRILITSRDFVPPPAGYLIECTPGCISVASAHGLAFGQITNYDASWIESLSNPLQIREWIVSGTQGEWKVSRLNPGSWCSTGGTKPRFERWGLRPLPDQHGCLGRLAFMSHRDDAYDPDLLLMTRAGARDGLVAYRRSEIEARAIDFSNTFPTDGQDLMDPICSTCAPAPTPVFTLDTHPEFQGWIPRPLYDAPGLFGGRAFTLDCDTFQLQAHGLPRWVVVAAAGYHLRDPSDPDLNQQPVPDPLHFHQAELVLYDLSTPTPTLQAKLYGNLTPGNATDVKSRTLNGRTYVFATDYGGRFHAFDVTDVFTLPTGSVLSPMFTWVPPPGNLDGTYENATEVELDSFFDAGQTHTLAYVAFYRIGIVVFDLTNAPNFTVLKIIDTPGLAEGVRLRDVGGVKSLLVADRMGGVRIYGQ